MAKKDSLNIEILKTLCDKKGDYYESKEGLDYIQALSGIFPLKNANDKPFTIEDIIKQPTLQEFNFSGVQDFKFICNLKAKPLKIINDNRENEKIIAYNFVDKEAEETFSNILGVTYIITCVINKKEHIIKIGSSRTTFKKRLASYNCGVVNNWRTASTTNIKILQSMVTTRLVFKLYLYDCNEGTLSYTWRGIESVPFASPKALAVEDIMVKQYYKQFKAKPLANVQTNATEVKVKLFSEVE